MELTSEDEIREPNMFTVDLLNHDMIQSMVACELCGETLSNHKNLESHIKMVHKKIKDAMQDFSCSNCDYKCFNKDESVKHARVHTGMKPFICEVCSQRICDIRNLRDHTRIVHEGFEVKCEECRNKYSHTVWLKDHMKLVHSGDI